MSRIERATLYWKGNPVEAIKDWFSVTPTDYQGDILNDMFKATDESCVRAAIKSAHGVGKTTLTAWAGWYWLITRNQSRVVSTAPVQAQLHDVLWPEYSKWWSRMPEQLRSKWRISGAHIRQVDNPMDWFAVARTSNRPENLQGFHSKHLMIQADEASGVPAPVFEVIEGALSEAELEGSEAYLMMTGNPNFNAGEFHQAFHRNKELYLLYTITGDPQTKPRKEDGKFYVSERVTKRYRTTMARKYGKDGAVYDVRVRGQFPRQEDGAVVPLEWAERAVRVPVPSFDRHLHGVTFVMDVARKGGDETVIGVFRQNHCLEMKAWPKTSTEQCVDIIGDYARRYQSLELRIERVVIDEPGVGGGVIDTAKRRLDLPITPYNGGQTMKAGKDPDEDVRMFANKRSRDWWTVRRAMEIEAVSIPDDETLVNQLASVHYDYQDKNDKIIVESKRAMRDRLGDDASPDRADVIVMGLAPWYSMADPTVFAVSEQDLIEGDDRPQPELDLW
jgi:hypothetical protein